MTRVNALPRGLSLIELLVTLSIAVVLLTVGVPSFVDMIAANTAVSYANDLLADLNYARNEAITRGFNVVVCKGIATAVGSGCTSGNWDGGWKVFVDCNGDQTISASTCPGNSDEAVLRVHPALSSEWTLRGDSHVPNYITFKAIGLPNTNGTLVFCQGGVLHSGNQPRSAAVTVNRTGRARVLSYNAYGVPLDNQGSALTSCHT